MGPGDFWLQSNNGKKQSLKDLKDIKLEDIAKNLKLQKFIKLFNLDGSGSIEVRNKNGQNEWRSIFTELQQEAVDDDLSNEEFGLYISKKMPNEDLKLEDVNELLDIASSQGNVKQIGDMAITQMNGFVAIKIKPNTTILAKNVNENGQFSDGDFIEMKTVDSEGKEITVKREEFKTKEGTIQCIVVTRQDSKDESSTTIYGTSSYYMYEIFKGEESLKAIEFYRKGNNEYYVQYTQEGNTITHAKNGDTVDSLIKKFEFKDREEFDRLNPSLKGKKYPNVADSIVVPGHYSAKDNKIVEQGTVYEEQYNYIKTVSEAERRKFKEEHLQKLDEDIFNKLNNLKGLELSNENIGLYFSLNSYPQETQEYIFNIITKHAKEGKTPDEIKTYFLSDPNAPKLTRQDGSKVNINLFNEFSIQMHDFVGTQADDTPQSVKGFIQDVMGLDISRGEGKELYDKLSEVGDPYVIMDINEMFSNIYHRTSKEYKDWYSEQVTKLNSDGWKGDKSIKTTGEREYLKEYPPISKETALEMYRAVINKMTAKDGENITTKYDEFIEDNKDVYLREFAALTLFSLHQSGAGNLQGTAAQKDILNPSKYLLQPVDRFYDKKGKEIYEIMMADCYKGNKKFESILKCYTTGYKQAGVSFDKAKMKHCMDVLQNPKSTEAQKKKALEDTFGYQVVNAAQDLIGVANFVDNVTDMALMIYGTGLIGKGLGKAVSFASKASTATRATAVITNTAKGISWGERLTQIGLSATNFAIWEGARFTINYYTNDIEEDFSYGSGLEQRMAGGAAFGTFAGAWGQFVTQPILKGIFKAPAQEAITKEATAFVSKQFKNSSKFTSKEVLAAFNAGQQKAMTSFGKEAVGFASEVTGFSLYEIGQKLIVGSDVQIRQILQDSKKYKPEGIDDLLKNTEELKKALKEVGCTDDVIRELTEINVGEVALGQLKTLLSFKAVGQLVYMHRAGKLPSSALNFGKEKPLEFETIKQNGKTMYKVKYSDGTTRTVADMKGVIALSNMHYQDVTLYKPIEQVLDKDGKMELNEGITLQKNTEGYFVTFNDGTKIEAKSLKDVMGKAQAEYTIMGYENELAQKGKVELPNKQVVTFDRDNKVYKTKIEDGVDVEASSFKELLQIVQKKTIYQNIEKTFTDDKKAVMLDEFTVIVKQDDGTYRMIVIEDGFPKEYTGKSVEEVIIQEICDKYKDLSDKELQAEIIRETALGNEGNVAELTIAFTQRGHKVSFADSEGKVVVEKVEGKINTKFEGSRPEQKDLLEGGVKAEELTEVAPFARHLAPYEVIDPIKAISENLEIRANKTSLDLTNFESTGLPLKYSTKEFAETLKNLVNDMKIEEQQAILEKFNIKLVFTKKGFELVDIPKLPNSYELKTPLERQIATEIERFTKNNEFMIENPEIKVFLDDFVKIVPEFLFMVGKQQHNAHAFTLDVHTLKVLQNAIEHPEYDKLSAEDKLVINTTILLHDIGKRFIGTTTPDNNHAEHGQQLAIELLDRFNLPSDIKQRITKLINNHEFFKYYNEAYISYQSEEGWNTTQKLDCENYGWKFTPRTDAKKYFNSVVKNVAGQMINSQDLQLAKILTFADLKSVNPEKVFVEESWTQGENKIVEYTGFEKFVTKTKTEEDFLNYIDNSLSFIEKELSQYPDGKIDNELVYKTELQQTSQKLFGYTGFFDRINRNQNQTYGVHRSDYDFCIRMRQQLIDMGYKPKNAVELLERLLKYDSNRNFDAKRTEDFINFYLKEKAFLEKHNIDLSKYRSIEEANESIDLIKQKENIANVFSKYNINDESLQKHLSNVLFIKEYQNGTTFSKEAFDKMVELLDTKKYTPEQVIQIIHNSFSMKNHRGCFRDNYNLDSCFNEQIYNTILDLAKLEPVERAIQDAHLCFTSATPESGWVVMPEFVEAIKTFNKLGIEEKSFIPMLFDIKFKEGKSQYDNTRVLESITPNESFDIALKYAKQGFNGYDLKRIVEYTEMTNGDTNVQEKIATLCKRGVMLDDFDNENIRRNVIECFDIDKYRFNEENYNFVLEMLNLGITPEQLNTLIYQSLSFNTNVAQKVAPTKIVETSRFNKAQVEALTKFYKEIGFDKIPRNRTNLVHQDLAASFMDTNLLPEEQAQMIINGDNVGRYKMNSYMAPFRVVNTDKYNQALEYYRKGVDISIIKELTQIPELWESLKTETDLSFVKTREDALLIANFWYLKDIKSIDELSKSEKMQLMTSMMINKSAFENNNVSTKIKLLPTTSEGYAQLMKTLAHSFGFDKPQYTEAQVQQVNMAFESMITSIQKANPSSLANDTNINKIVTEIKTLIPELANIDLSYLQRVFNNPSFETLSSKEKTMITLTSLFSSSELSLADVAIDASVCAMRLGLSKTDAMNIHAIVKNSNLVNDFMSINKSTKINNSRSYVIIKSSTLDEAFTTAALELKDYNNYQMARMLYTAKENYLSSEMLKEFAPELYNEFNALIKSGKSSNEAINIISNNPSNFDKIESIKLMAAEKYAPSRHFNKMLEAEIKHIKASDVLLPQTDLQGFIAKQTPEWIEAHTRLINGRKVLVISSDEIPDFYHFSHTTQAFAITGKADATTNISNFEAFAMLFDNKTVCLSYSGNGKTAVVGTTGLLIKTENTSQYIARGTDIASVAKDIPAMVSEYISRRSSIEQIGFQSKRTKDFDRQYFASMIKEELQAGYRELLNKKLTLEEQIRNGYADENITQELQIIEAQMLAIDEIYIQKLDALIKKADGKPIDIEFIRQNDPELGQAYDKVLSYINVEHRGDDGLMRTEYHNEVLGSKTTPVGIFVINEKALFELTDDYLKKAEEDNMPVVILK